MFAEYLGSHSLADLVISSGEKFPVAADRAAWQGIRPECREELLQLAEAYREKPYPMRRATDFLAFVRDGSRKADENPFFFRRRKLCAHAMGYCMQPNDRDLDEVIDGLWCICEESSWVISAHNVNPIPGAPSSREYPLPDTDKPYVDLFAAQTGMVLALVSHLLADALDGVTPLLRSRVHKELQQRVFAPFMATDDFWWMGVKRKDLNNWTPWILSNIMLAAEYTMADRAALAALLERSCIMLDRWLDTVPEDGGCDEGAGYWNMAGGALLDCLDVLERVTGGCMTFWQDEKLRRVLSFPAKAQVQGKWFINFADCDACPILSGERLQWAGQKLGDARLIALGEEKQGKLADELNDTPHFSRLLYKVFHPVLKAETQTAPVDTWLPDLQVRMIEQGGMTLCAKGGHNGENHNHNDVGSFMLYVDGQPQIVDAGNMVYTAKTFSSERYTLWNVRAAYHNIPMIGSHEQPDGVQYAARDVLCLPNGLSLDMAGAYAPEAGVAACQRKMELTGGTLRVQDDITLHAPQSVTWVLMLRHAPAVAEGMLRTGSIAMAVDADLAVDIEEIPVTDARMARNYPGSLWRVRLTAPEAAEHHRVWVVEKA
ncbi:MAG: heparinase II/III family protein [Clostridia bacterium]|nr:heparinase II/III family protein [Clostridia bacterium]